MPTDPTPAALFPEVPEDLSALTRADLEALAGQIAQRAALIADPAADGRAEVIGDLPLADVLAQADAALTAAERIAEHLGQLDEQEAEQAAQLESLSTRAAALTSEPEGDAPEAEADEQEAEQVEEPEGDEPDEAPAEAEAEQVEEPVAVAASGTDLVAAIAEAVRQGTAAAAAKPRRRARVPARNEGRERRTGDGPAQSLSLVASGEGLESREQLAQAVSERLNGFVGRPVSSDERITVARLSTEYPEDRHIGGGREATEAVLSRVFSRDNLSAPQALTAAGGICAPPVPMYDVETFAVDDRPVAAAHPSFNAERGGVTYRLPSTMGLMTGANGVMTAEEDAEFITSGDDEGMPANVKSCLRIECPDLVTTEVEAIYSCLTIGNFGARTWPEDVAHNVDLAAAEWARLAERRFIDVIKTASTAVTDAGDGGAWLSIVATILKARAGMISRHRMSDAQRFRVMLPSWLGEALPMDGIRGGLQGNNAELTRQTVASSLERYGVSVSWYKDGVTAGTAQLFGAQSTGAITEFPAEVQWAFFPEGSFFVLDNGTLDLGLVRDSVLNSTNDYQLFMEAFLKVAYRGIESLWVTSTICYSGQTQQAGEIVACADPAATT
jgi:hypothetical protein